MLLSGCKPFARIYELFITTAWPVHEVSLWDFGGLSVTISFLAICGSMCLVVVASEPM